MTGRLKNTAIGHDCPQL